MNKLMIIEECTNGDLNEILRMHGENLEKLYIYNLRLEDESDIINTLPFTLREICIFKISKYFSELPYKYHSNAYNKYFPKLPFGCKFIQFQEDSRGRVSERIFYERWHKEAFSDKYENISVSINGYIPIKNDWGWKWDASYVAQIYNSENTDYLKSKPYDFLTDILVIRKNTRTTRYEVHHYTIVKSETRLLEEELESIIQN